MYVHVCVYCLLFGNAIFQDIPMGTRQHHWHQSLPLLQGMYTHDYSSKCTCCGIWYFLWKLMLLILNYIYWEQFANSHAHLSLIMIIIILNYMFVGDRNYHQDWSQPTKRGGEASLQGKQTDRVISRQIGSHGGVLYCGYIYRLYDETEGYYQPR